MDIQPEQFTQLMYGLKYLGYMVTAVGVITCGALGFIIGLLKSK